MTAEARSSAPAPLPEQREEEHDRLATTAEAPLPPAAPVSARLIPEPIVAARPIVVPPPVAPSPMSIDELRPILEQAGLTLVQTEPSKLADVLAKFAGEVPPVRAPRERPVLPPPDVGPLVQVETRRAGAAPQ